MWARRQSYATLVWIILGQQVSQASAEALYLRLSRSLGRVTVTNVMTRTQTELRALGLTRQKARYCQELAMALRDGTLSLTALRLQSDHAVRAALTQVTGIGRWTADVYLLMAMQRPDIWPIGDLALYKAFREIKGTNQAADVLDQRAGDWRPWRSVAARILWHHYISVRKKPR
jgi:DNA-3-methyladenine glycosylase II